MPPADQPPANADHTYISEKKYNFSRVHMLYNKLINDIWKRSFRNPDRTVRVPKTTRITAADLFSGNLFRKILSGEIWKEKTAGQQAVWRKYGKKECRHRQKACPSHTGEHIPLLPSDLPLPAPDRGPGPIYPLQDPFRGQSHRSS